MPTPENNSKPNSLIEENLYPISLLNVEKEIFEQLFQVNTVESMASTMLDRKAFTENEIEWMKKTPISAVIMGENYPENDKCFFNLSKSGEDIIGLKVSARTGAHEFRGQVMREMIRNEQENGSKKNVYDALQDRFNSLAFNPSWKMVASGLAMGLLNDSKVGYLKGFAGQSLLFQAMQTQMEQRILEFGEKFKKERDNNQEILIDNNVFTDKDKECCDKILKEINAKPLPQNIINALNAYEDFEQKIGGLLKEDTLSKLETEQCDALESLYENLLDAARNNLMKHDNHKGFKKECNEAFNTAEAALKQSGLWANVFKPLLLCIAVVCSAFTLLASQTVKDGIRNDSTSMRKVNAMKSALNEIKMPQEEVCEDTPTPIL
jgi:hypothetical protein